MLHYIISYYTNVNRSARRTRSSVSWIYSSIDFLFDSIYSFPYNHHIFQEIVYRVTANIFDVVLKRVFRVVTWLKSIPVATHVSFKSSMTCCYVYVVNICVNCNCTPFSFVSFVVHWKRMHYTYVQVCCNIFHDLNFYWEIVTVCSDWIIQSKIVSSSINQISWLVLIFYYQVLSFSPIKYRVNAYNLKFDSRLYDEL